MKEINFIFGKGVVVFNAVDREKDLLWNVKTNEEIQRWCVKNQNGTGTSPKLKKTDIRGQRF